MTFVRVGALAKCTTRSCNLRNANELQKLRNVSELAHKGGDCGTVGCACSQACPSAVETLHVPIVVLSTRQARNVGCRCPGLLDCIHQIRHTSGCASRISSRRPDSLCRLWLTLARYLGVAIGMRDVCVRATMREVLKQSCRRCWEVPVRVVPS